MGRKITISTGAKSGIAPRQGIQSDPPVSKYGVWGKVLERHSVDHSVDVQLATGHEVTHIPVASREWTTIDEKPILGARDLPPKGAIVFVMMPSGEIDSGFVLASCFLPIAEKQKDDFLVKDKETEALSVIEGGWKKTYDKEKGDLQVEDDDSFILIVKKSEKKIDLTDWNGNKLVIDENGAKVTDKNSNEITMDGSGVIVKDNNGNKVELAAGGATITTTQGKITGGMLTVNGNAAPTGQGPFCALPFCPITGAPHVGQTVAGT